MKDKNLTAKQAFLKGIHNVTRCARDKDGAAIGCSKCPLITKTACTMELIAWDMVRGGVLYG